jgi:hypothetical protein
MAFRFEFAVGIRRGRSVCVYGCDVIRGNCIVRLLGSEINSSSCGSMGLGRNVFGGYEW